MTQHTSSCSSLRMLHTSPRSSPVLPEFEIFPPIIKRKTYHKRFCSSDIQTEIRTYTKPSFIVLLHASTDRALLLYFAASVISSSYSKSCTQVTNPRTRSRQQLQYHIGTKHTVQRNMYQSTVFECIAYEYNLFFLSHTWSLWNKFQSNTSALVLYSIRILEMTESFLKEYIEKTINCHISM